MSSFELSLLLFFCIFVFFLTNNKGQIIYIYNYHEIYWKIV